MAPPLTIFTVCIGKILSVPTLLLVSVSKYEVELNLLALKRLNKARLVVKK